MLRRPNPLATVLAGFELGCVAHVPWSIVWTAFNRLDSSQSVAHRAGQRYRERANPVYCVMASATHYDLPMKW